MGFRGGAYSGGSTGAGGGGGAVSSIFGRIGDVIAAVGDYISSKITRSATADISSTNVEAALQEIDNERVTVRRNSTGSTLQRSRLNVVEGSSRITATIADDAVDNEVDLTLDVPAGAFETTGAVAAHVAAADPHTQYALDSDLLPLRSLARPLLLGAGV
jgi:hypothetical protein